MRVAKGAVPVVWQVKKNTEKKGEDDEKTRYPTTTR
jgi:hypothetical protein